MTTPTTAPPHTTRPAPGSDAATGCSCVRAGEAAARTGMAADAAAMLAVAARWPGAIVDELRDEVDLTAFVGGSAALEMAPIAVLERGSSLARST